MPFLSPVGNDSQIDVNGKPLSGGLIYTYAAGTSTPVATFTDSAGLVPQSNPIVLNSRGLPDSPIWLTGGQAIKMAITAADGTSQRTVDNITGINDASTPSQDQWVLYGPAPTFVSAGSFSVVGDQTAIFQPARRVRLLVGAGYVYGTISGSVYAAPNTTVTVALDSGSITADLTKVSYGLLTLNNGATPGGRNFTQGGITAAVSAGGSLVVNFPVRFPNALVSVVATYANSGAIVPATGNPHQIVSTSPVAFAIANGGSGSAQYNWIAVGY